MKKWFFGHSRAEQAALGVVAVLIFLGSVSAVAATVAPDSMPRPVETTASPTPTPEKSTPKPVVTYETETVTETIPFETNTVEDPDLDVGQTRIATAGVPGEVQRQVRVTYVDGKETKREPLPDVVTREPVPEVVAHGTRQPAPPPPPPAPEAPAAPANCPNGTYTNSAGNEVCSPYESPSAPAGATARCNDGTWSFSQSRRGTCSHHGGVAAWL
ncbi:G5 domain-containing protein [Aeromicrobium phragmitis]|uniref:G5 domain-containing protein n=1 Tax=Aeromicrobium phragmitis TaxID=2478914 RepID=UPI001AA08D76|nr:G5 domain-containing protein [Aeromicrobium phragmitis]